jgi:hypothetical protein
MNSFYLILFTLIVNRVVSYPYKNKYYSGILNSCGTFAHELAHLSISLILNGKPISFSIIPYREEEKISLYTKIVHWIKFKLFGIQTIYNQDLILGGVGHTNLKWYNSFFIGLAPLLLILLAYYLNIYLFNNIDQSLTNQLLTILLSVIIISNSVPSKSDIKIAFKYKFASLLFILIIATYFIYVLLENCL